MHELVLTRSVVDTVVNEAEKAGAKRVSAVYLTIGYARDIVDELFEGCFAHFARNTVADEAELVIQRVPLTVRCKNCDLVYHIDVFNEETWPCYSCGTQDYTLSSGMEFCINSIEIETEAGDRELC